MHLCAMAGGLNIPTRTAATRNLNMKTPLRVTDSEINCYDIGGLLAKKSQREGWPSLGSLTVR